MNLEVSICLLPFRRGSGIYLLEDVRMPTYTESAIALTTPSRPTLDLDQRLLLDHIRKLFPLRFTLRSRLLQPRDGFVDLQHMPLILRPE